MTMHTETIFREKDLGEDELFHVESVLVEVGDKEDEFRSYESSCLNIKVTKDGNISLYDSKSDAFVWISRLEIMNLLGACEVALNVPRP